MLAIFLVSLIAFVLGLLLTAAMRELAPRWGLTDAPDAHRKLHGRPIPLGGGLAVFGATSAVLFAVLLVPNPWNLRLPEDWWDVGTFLAAGLVLVLVGLIDDLGMLRGRQKLLGQVVAAGILVAGGLAVQRIELFGVSMDLGVLGYVFTVFWLVGAINAVNLLDGADGLAASLGIILSITLAALAAMTGHVTVAAVACVFASSLLGFLWFNRPPASIFLGDTGSMLIGMMVGAMAIRASLKGPGTVLLAAPMAVLAIPILDTATAIVRRKLTGRSIYTTDRGHLHHRLFDRLGSNGQVLACVGVCCAVSCSAALASVSLRNDAIALVTCAGLVAILVISGVFGRGELALLVGRGRRLTQSLVPRFGRVRTGRQTRVRLQGSRRWELLWEDLRESAERLNLCHVALDVNLASVQESFNATWDRPEGCERDDQWRIAVPLAVDERTVGHLVIIGERNGAPICHDLQYVLEFIDAFHTDFEDFAAKKRPEPVGLGDRASKIGDRRSKIGAPVGR